VDTLFVPSFFLVMAVDLPSGVNISIVGGKYTGGGGVICSPTACYYFILLSQSCNGKLCGDEIQVWKSNMRLVTRSLPDCSCKPAAAAVGKEAVVPVCSKDIAAEVQMLREQSAALMKKLDDLNI
jgi:hypothetical protein